MQLTEDFIDPSLHRITRFTESSVTIPPNTYFSSILVSGHFLDTEWSIKSWSDLTAQAIQDLLKHAPEIMIFGTGKDLILPPEALLAPFFENNIGVECMQNRAACHTYTVLLSEERKVLLGLMLP